MSLSMPKPQATNRCGSSSGVPGRRRVYVDCVAFDRLRAERCIDAALLAQRREGGEHDVVPVDLEEAPEFRSRVASAEAVRAERDERCSNVVADQLGPGAHVV